ncbi:hypothetical protein TCAL_16680 [Tigriopus californicus]|uniref:C-type lectin domain-containing protein n=1 Tax=Tigriopus californicus TaxID=6832 RepID=A0A553PKG5_TIGCA|nr:hypothetical protein TCAL_16680 [Tigriopus californicus]
MCYKIAISLASFIEAEIACSSNRDETGRYRSQLMWTRKREHYEFVQRVLVEKVGESEFWVGLDDLAGLGEFETSTGGEFVNRSDPIWAILNAGQGDCAKIPGPNGGFLTTDVCSKPLAYVCQQRPLYESPDNHCPDGFFSYKSSCLLPVREEMEFNQAQIHCGLHGSSLYASKSLADFQFIKQYARNHKPTCAPGYDLLGHVTDGRTCYKVTNTTILGTFDEDVCNAQYDESRWLGTPDTKLYTEEVIGLMR